MSPSRLPFLSTALCLLIAGAWAETARATAVGPNLIQADLEANASSSGRVYVDADNVLGPWQGTLDDPYNKIQDAIDASADGAVVMVATGTYDENIFLPGRNIVLRSVDPTDRTIVEQTVISGGDRDRVVTFSGAEALSCVLTGFTITGGRRDDLSGGSVGAGILGNGTRATIRGNHIVDNTLPTRSFSEAQHDPSNRGAGLYDCDGLIEGNIISGNRAEHTFLLSMDPFGGIDFELHPSFGGALAGCDGRLVNNVVYDNEATSGGALHDCQGPLINNTLFGNLGGGALECRGEIRNCVFWQNGGPELESCATTPSFSCLRGWAGGGVGNIVADPLFVDSANGDFHLVPRSPCIDAGGFVEGLSRDIDNDPRPYDARGSEGRGDGSNLDIGADEFFLPVPSVWMAF